MAGRQRHAGRRDGSWRRQRAAAGRYSGSDSRQRDCGATTAGHSPFSSQAWMMEFRAVRVTRRPKLPHVCVAAMLARTTHRFSTAGRAAAGSCPAPGGPSTCHCDAFLCVISGARAHCCQCLAVASAPRRHPAPPAPPPPSGARHLGTPIREGHSLRPASSDAHSNIHPHRPVFKPTPFPGGAAPHCDKFMETPPCT